MGTGISLHKNFLNFRNTTRLDSRKLELMFLEAIAGWPPNGIRVAVRYSRGADFSGSCFYDTNQIYINLGRNNRYPYRLQTHIARPQSNRTHWWRELYSIDIPRAEELVLFVFLHEFYHWLIRRARRNVRQKEGRCDRFATRVLVDRFGAKVRDSAGRPVSRSMWDFQDLDGFVASARRPARQLRSARKPHPPRTKQASSPQSSILGPQLPLFPG